MTIPAFVFCLLVSSFYGSCYHLVRGGSITSLLADILVSIIGFFLGHYLSSLMGFSFFRLGTISFGTGTLISWIFLIITGWSSKPY